MILFKQGSPSISPLVFFLHAWKETEGTERNLMAPNMSELQMSIFLEPIINF